MNSLSIRLPAAGFNMTPPDWPETHQLMSSRVFGIRTWSLMNSTMWRRMSSYRLVRLPCAWCSKLSGSGCSGTVVKLSSWRIGQGRSSFPARSNLSDIWLCWACGMQPHSEQGSGSLGQFHGKIRIFKPVFFIGWHHSCQPIRSQAWKFLLTAGNMDFS